MRNYESYLLQLQIYNIRATHLCLNLSNLDSSSFYPVQYTQRIYGELQHGTRNTVPILLWQQGSLSVVPGSLNYSVN